MGLVCLGSKGLRKAHTDPQPAPVSWAALLLYAHQAEGDRNMALLLKEGTY